MALEKPSEHLELSFYQQLKYFSYLKGFLKPFKGKGDWEYLLSQAEETRTSLIRAVREIAKLLCHPPWSLLDVMLRVQASKKYGTTFLRWSSRDMKVMGMGVWERLMLDPKTPESLLEELHAMEQMRIAINMQVSATQTLLRMAKDCTEKSAYAEAVLALRLSGETLSGEALKPLPKMLPQLRGRGRNRMKMDN